LPRLYREAPVNAIWEGSGNVMCLDVLRALGGKAGEQEVLGALANEATDLPGARNALDFIGSTLSDGDAESRARAAVDRMALLAAAAALRTTASPVADLFARTRLQDCQGSMFGAGDIAGDEARRLLERASPSA
jgi:putative acyl-CoA dehydrogenase